MPRLALAPQRSHLVALSNRLYDHRRQSKNGLSLPVIRSVSSSSSSSSTSWWSRMVTAFRTGNLSDDQTNPKKRLERHSYLYYALLALQYRTIRLDPQSGQTTTTTTNDSASIDTDALYDQATHMLDTMGLDQLSNVALRQQMQSMLRPQVQTVLTAFDKVDAHLGVTSISPPSSPPPPPPPQAATAANPSITPPPPPPQAAAVAKPSIAPPTSTSPLRDQNISNDMGVPVPITSVVLPNQCRGILSAEWDRTCQQLSEDTSRSKESVTFLQTKQEAISLLASFYGWSLPNDDAVATRIVDSHSNVDAFGMSRSNLDESNVSLIRYHQTLNLCRSTLLRHEIGYSIVVLRSNVDTLGRGVFLDGSALAGSIVAFQPGDVWPKEHLLTNSPDVMDHFDDTDGDDDCRVSLRFDDFVIDARRSPVTVLTQEGSVNPWALGHMVNHPNFPVQQPNALSIMLNYTDTMKLAKLVRYIPNTYARVPSWQSVFFDPDVIMHGLCLLARRDVCDEELLYDYRLQTDEPPDWYSVVRYDDGFEEDQVVFFREPERNTSQRKE